MGLHLFGGTLGDLEDGLPRSTFDTFLDACMSIFQMLTGENWNSLMYDVVYTNGPGAVFFFLAVMILGGFIMLNLFLAVMLLKTMNAFRCARMHHVIHSPTLLALVLTSCQNLNSAACAPRTVVGRPEPDIERDLIQMDSKRQLREKSASTDLLSA